MGYMGDCPMRGLHGMGDTANELRLKQARMRADLKKALDDKPVDPWADNQQRIYDEKESQITGRARND